MDKDKYFEVVAEYKLLAKHEVGQNFLIDKDCCARIVSLLECKKEDKVLEIGSGAGSLSVYLCDEESDADLVDIDEGLVLKLQNDFKGIPNIHPQYGNALKWDLQPYNKIISNLPYYITSSLLETILLKAPKIEKGVFMVQKEAFNRLNAKIGSNEYGPFQILIEYRGGLKREFNVPRLCFAPAPHVDSTVFSFVAKPDSNIETAGKLYALCGKLFLNRRKTIYNNLTSYFSNSTRAKEILSKCGIDEKRRPETLSLKDYLSILSAIEDK